MLRTLFFAMLSVSTLNAQTNNDSIQKVEDSIPRIDNTHQFKFKKLILPATLIGLGVWGFENHDLLNFNAEISAEVTEHIDEKITIDDFSQYAPTASVYALNAAGIEGRHNFKDRTIIMATSYLIMSGTVLGLKTLTKVERPDGSAFNSFPSGHTATAFAGAEFLFQEYKDKSIWYGVAGYAVATGTGLFRMYNNRHWFTDVVAGAGIGVLSTKIAYWIHPFIQEKIFHSKAEKGTSAIAPFYNGKQFGVGFIKTF